MTTPFIYSAENTLPKTSGREKEVPGSSWTFRHIGAGIGLLGGTLFLFIAICLSVFQYFYAEAQHGIWLYLIVLPLCIFGAYCFEQVEAIETAEKIKYCRRHRLTGENCEKPHSPNNSLK